MNGQSVISASSPPITYPARKEPETAEIESYFLWPRKSPANVSSYLRLVENKLKVCICFLAHLAMPKMSLYDHHLSLSLSVLLLASVSVGSSPINFQNGCHL